MFRWAQPRTPGGCSHKALKAIRQRDAGRLAEAKEALRTYDYERPTKTKIKA